MWMATYDEKINITVDVEKQFLSIASNLSPFLSNLCKILKHHKCQKASFHS